MKKIAICSLLVALVSNNIFAETVDSKSTDSNSQELVSTENNVARNWWNNGLQIGAGVPLMLPMTGYNFFVGYVNKNSSSFFGKRIGGRLDFQIPSAMTAKATFKNGGIDSYKVNTKFDVLFLSQSIDFDMDHVMIDSDDNPVTQDTAVDLVGTNAKISLKNQNIGAILDFYPFGDTWFLGGIRLSGGYYIGDMEAKLSATVPNILPDSTGMSYDVGSGNLLYSRLKAGSKISGKMKWSYSGPYAGLGFDLGVIKGFKFYMDAGVVFTDAPRLKDEDFVLPTNQIELCYKANGSVTACDWVPLDIDKGAPDLMGRALGSVIGGIIEDGTGAPDQYGVNYDDINPYLPPEYQGAGYDPNAIGQDMATYLMGGGVGWIDFMLLSEPAIASSDLGQAIIAIHTDPTTAIVGNDLSELQTQINDAIADYKENRKDTIDDANDSLKDFKFVPMIKLGVMYRF
jgi:hypothetical protein